DLLGPAQAAMLARPHSSAAGPAPLAAAMLAIENLKLATLQVSAMGAMAYMQGLEREQELVARVADLVGYVYLAESALLRAETLLGSKHLRVAFVLANLYAFSAVDRARPLAAEALRRIPRGLEALPRLETYLPDHGVDLIALRRRNAEAVYAADGYPLG